MALELKSNPNHFFEAPDNPVFHQKLGNTLTIEAWVFSMDMAGERMIVNKEDSYEIALRNNGLYDTALNGGGGWDWHSSSLKVAKEKWAHVATTWDGKVVLMYVNGKKSSAKKEIAGNALNVTSSTFKVGKRERGEPSHSIFFGFIDEVRVSKVLRYTKDFDLPIGAFEPDDDTMALYHFAAFGDYDNDGDIDIFLNNSNQTANLLRNDGGNKNHWLMIKTVGTKSNRDGIGTRIKVVSGTLSQIKEVKSGSSYLSQNDLRVLFGLGGRTKVDLIELRWPSGITEKFFNVKANQLLIITEKQGMEKG